MKIFSPRMLTVLSILIAGTSPFVTEATLQNISNFSVISEACESHDGGTLYRAFRKFELDRAPHLLVVDTDTLETRVMKPSELNCAKEGLSERVEKSRYGLALRKAASPPFPLSNDGIRRSSIHPKGVFLTADLCPAGDGKFEHRFFNELETVSIRHGEATPIALAITGKWIRRHEVEFDEILHLIEKKKISVTWMNHSDTHPYRIGGAFESNFLLTPGTNMSSEIEKVEIELLRRGQVPSIFFRFPGLVSDRAWIENLASHSLIAVGSDAWLALGQSPKKGSIILVHANGNEPLGITRFLHSLVSIEELGKFLPLSKLF